MILTKEGADLIKKFEGLRLDPYLDAVGIPTIGWGHTGSKTDRSITLAEAEDIFAEDISQFVDGVTAMVKEATPQQFSAMVSLAYNIGLGNFAKSSVRRLHNEGKYLEAADAFLMWVKASRRTLPGLVRRRQAEKDLYLSERAVA